MTYEQLKLFPFEEKEEQNINCQNSQGIEYTSNISEKLASEMAIQELPFLGCDFDVIYPMIEDVLPRENITFEIFGVEQAIICEIICAAICHHINWDYLRQQIYLKTKANPDWLILNNLQLIGEDDVYRMLCTYEKKERIRAKERANIIREIGYWAKRFINIKDIYLNAEGEILDYEMIHSNMILCKAFADDPQEKKLQLLIQKLSLIDGFQELSRYYHPAIDYHLMRNYLRRGLIYCKTKYAREYVENSLATRKEKTVAAIRGHCSCMLEEISMYTGLEISLVNQIEWQIGRSVCTNEKADCKLERKESQWLKSTFAKCPFYDTCMARCYNQDYLDIKEPNYNGSSY